MVVDQVGGEGVVSDGKDYLPQHRDGSQQLQKLEPVLLPRPHREKGFFQALQGLPSQLPVHELQVLPVQVHVLPLSGLRYLQHSFQFAEGQTVLGESFGQGADVEVLDCWFSFSFFVEDLGLVFGV